LKQTSENTGVAITIGKSSETGIIVYTKQNNNTMHQYTQKNTNNLII